MHWPSRTSPNHSFLQKWPSKAELLECTADAYQQLFCWSPWSSHFRAPPHGHCPSPPPPHTTFAALGMTFSSCTTLAPTSTLPRAAARSSSTTRRPSDWRPSAPPTMNSLETVSASLYPCLFLLRFFGYWRFTEKLHHFLVTQLLTQEEYRQLLPSVSAWLTNEAMCAFLFVDFCFWKWLGLGIAMLF